MFIKCPTSIHICYPSTAGPVLDLIFVTMGLLPDTLDCRLRIRRECWERFPRHHGLAIPTCITARAWRPCRDAWRWENVPGIPGAWANPQFYVSGKRPIVPTSALAPNGVRPSADTVLTTMLHTESSSLTVPRKRWWTHIIRKMSGTLLCTKLFSRPMRIDSRRDSIGQYNVAISRNSNTVNICNSLIRFLLV